MNIPKSSKRVSNTWLDEKGITYTYSLDKDPLGLRINVIEWEKGHTIIKLIKGDGRRLDFKEYKTKTIPSHDQEEIKKVVIEYLEFCKQLEYLETCKETNLI